MGEALQGESSLVERTPRVRSSIAVMVSSGQQLHSPGLPAPVLLQAHSKDTPRTPREGQLSRIRLPAAQCLCKWPVLIWPVTKDTTDHLSLEKGQQLPSGWTPHALPDSPYHLDTLAPREGSPAKQPTSVAEPVPLSVPPGPSARCPGPQSNRDSSTPCVQLPETAAWGWWTAARSWWLVGTPWDSEATSLEPDCGSLLCCPQLCRSWPIPPVPGFHIRQKLWLSNQNNSK